MPPTPALDAVLRWWDREGRALPWRETRDPYAIWVSEVMLQQTQVDRVVPRFVEWIERWPSAAALADAELAEVLAAWSGLGYPRRARALWLGAAIVARDGWPERLEDLPGVGPYTAAAIRCFAFEEPVLPPDVNVRRVLARRFAGGVDVAPDPWRTGQALMELGQRICVARAPRCAECPVADGCGFDPADDPAPRRRPQARYEGSFRQRRGDLLHRVLADGPVALADADPEAARSLVADGLLRLASDELLAP